MRLVHHPSSEIGFHFVSPLRPAPRYDYISKISSATPLRGLRLNTDWQSLHCSERCSHILGFDLIMRSYRLGTAPSEEGVCVYPIITKEAARDGRSRGLARSKFEPDPPWEGGVIKSNHTPQVRLHLPDQSRDYHGLFRS